MYKIIVLISILVILLINTASSQSPDDINLKLDKDYTKKDLTERVLNEKSKNVIIEKQNLSLNEKKSTKSPGLAFIYSLILPGAGQFYTDRMDVGKYFVAAEVTCWLGVIGLNLHGNAIRDDARSYASIHADLNKEGKDDDYFKNIGSYNNIYEYNDEKLRRGEYELIYDVNKYFWNWDNSNNRLTFDSQRKKSERIYNTTIVFATGLVVNRITSAISALILANNHNKDALSSFKINSEFIGTKDNPFDGIKLNFVKEF